VRQRVKHKVIIVGLAGVALALGLFKLMQDVVAYIETVSGEED
jgi:hypothetical protein